jgi:DNA polymerase-3 subunit delta'
MNPAARTGEDVFDRVVGQERIKGRFAADVRGLAAGRGLHHAFLFVGSAGLGKRAFAEELAALIVARGEQDDVFRRALAGAHPDVYLVEREGDVIRYEQVRQLVGELSRKPFLAAERVWIIDEADKLHVAAANKLLKSLEEPPAHVVFLLVSSEPQRLLPTIVSRCEVVPFEPVSREDVLVFLEEHRRLTGPTAEAVANLAGGSVGRAAALAEDAAGPDLRGTLLDLVIGAVSGQAVASQAVALVKDRQEAVVTAVGREAAAAAATVEASIQDERDRAWHVDRLKARAKRDAARETRRVALEAVDVVLSALRDLWVASLGEAGVLLNTDRYAAIAQAAPATRSERLARALAAAQATRKDMLLNVDRELALLALFCKLEEVSAS